MAKARARKKPPARRKPKPRNKPKIADSPKQPELVAIKVPASPNSDTAPARKLLEAIGRRPPPKHERRR